jgi:ABC-type polysaccharide/polyol phosphate transport system ATPase subunit
MTPAIRLVECSKSYRLYHQPSDRLWEWISGRPSHTVFPALEPVDLEIRKGESIGVIGHNGAGKSTLLKLLCGVTQPTSGEVHVDGTVASILELGTGFHPEFSGRDNAALNAAILGLSPAEVREQLPAIYEFSELGTFLDQPVKTYSSGMYMRLAFSLAVNVNPEILIIDEALAVGDGHFQKKCIDRIREFQTRGRTIVFCSHALYFVSTLCDRTLWLDHGKLQRFGPTVDVVHEYEKHLLEQEKKRGDSAPSQEEQVVPPVRIREVWFEDARGSRRNVFETGEDIHLRLSVESDDPGERIHVLAGFDRAADDMQCFAIGTNFDQRAPLSGESEYEIVLKLRRVPLVRGDYSLALFVGDEHGMHVFDRRDLRPAFSIGGDRYEIGLIRVDHEWDMVSERVGV